MQLCDIWQVCGFLRVLDPVFSTNKTDKSRNNLNNAESGVKHHNPNPLCNFEIKTLPVTFVFAGGQWFSTGNSYFLH
jgi:hypothetical protein